MEHSVIPNKYLNYTRKLDDGDLVFADNIVNNNGKIVCRPGWQWAGGDDMPFLASGTGYAVSPLNGIFFNNNPWFFGKDNVTGETKFFYKPNLSTTTPWRVGDNSSMVTDFGAAPSEYKPLLHENAKRLLIGSSRGLAVVPKTTDDYSIGGFWRGATPRIAGSATAIGISAAPTLVDTTVTAPVMRQNWLPVGAQVAYRVVWSFYDFNGHYVFGAPSERFVVQNTSAGSRAVEFTIIVPDKIVDIMSSSYQLSPSCEIYRTRSQAQDDAGNPIDPGDEMFFAGEVRPTLPVPTSITFIDIATDQVLQDPLYTNETQEGALAARYNISPHKTSHVWQGMHFFANYWNPYITNFELGGVQDADGAIAAADKRGLRNNDILILGDLAFQMTTGAPSAKQIQMVTTAGSGNQIARVVGTTRAIAAKFNATAKSTGIGSRYSLYVDNGPDDYVGKLRLMSTDNTDVLQLKDQYYRPHIGLYRANGWATVSDPSPISPDPRIDGNKGVGHMLARVDRVGGGGNQRLIFTASAAVDFVDGDIVQMAKMDDSAVGVGWTYVPQGVYRAVLVAGADFSLELIDQPGVYVSAAAAAFPYVSATGLGACVCTRDSQTSRSNQCGPDDNYYPARLAYSPPYEPESWKLNEDWIRVGDSSKQIIGISSVGDNLLVFKEDGLYRVVGEYPDFQVIQADDTCVLWGGGNVVSGDSACYAWGQKGIYQITLNRIDIISLDIQSEIDRIIKTGSPKPVYLIAHRGRNVVEFWYNDPLEPSFTTNEHANCAFAYDGEGWTRRVEPMAISLTGTKIEYSSSEVQFGYRPFANMLLVERVSALIDDQSDETFRITGIDVLDNSNANLSLSANVYDTDASREFMTWLEQKLTFSKWRTTEIDAFAQGEFLISSATITGTGVMRITGELASRSGNGLEDVYGGTGAFPATDNRIYSSIAKKVAWAFSGDPRIMKRIPQLQIEFDQPRFVSAEFSSMNDTLFSQSTATTVNGYNYGTELVGNSFYPGRPLNDIGTKSITVSMLPAYQSGYQFYLILTHSYGRDNFAVLSVSPMAMSGNNNIIRKNNQ
jgi:hypothetical protein